MLQFAKKYLFKISLFGISLTFFSWPSHIQAAEQQQNMTGEQVAFVNEIAPHAIKLQKEYGILASITISQAILESNWGKSELAQKGKNLFGIKGAYRGRSINMSTKECIDSDWVEIKADFRAYPSWYDSIFDHALLFTQGTSWNPNLYNGVINQSDYISAASALGDTGYSSDPKYKEKIIYLIKNFNLTKYDHELESKKINEAAVSGIATFEKNKKVKVYSEPTGIINSKQITELHTNKVKLIKKCQITPENQIWYKIQANDLTGWISEKETGQLSFLENSKEKAVAKTSTDQPHWLIFSLVSIFSIMNMNM
ncbi:glycoside hydrolase family 73 protein [Listeria sp. PSOL-1]|uniref:glycoside hydrolase family 73 protein n=1 Tax=Listeria sp. PSOL-1 TaxID=1844999 RepID=UPI0013D176EC|nr:glycoside hydrolase family 73 protein [Listeria sp. PSOL-1]